MLSYIWPKKKKHTQNNPINPDNLTSAFQPAMCLLMRIWRFFRRAQRGWVDQRRPLPAPVGKGTKQREPGLPVGTLSGLWVSLSPSFIHSFRLLLMTKTQYPIKVFLLLFSPLEWQPTLQWKSKNKVGLSWGEAFWLTAVTLHSKWKK